MYQILKQLTAHAAVSGGEQALRREIEKSLSPFADEMHTDALGNLIAVRHGNSAAPKKIMLAAHTDTAGLIVTYIEECGLLRFGKIGNMDLTAAAFACVQSERGVRGVLAPAGHTELKEYAPDCMYIDIGAKDRRAAMRRVQVGERFAFSPSLCRLSHTRIGGQPLCRISCAILLDIAKKLPPPQDDIYFVFTTQAEAGHRGAKTAAFTVEPDLALVFDLSPAGDAAGKDASPCLGGGAAILIKDAQTLCDMQLSNRLLTLAKLEKIPVQPIVSASKSTDAAAIQSARAGCAAAALTIPARYTQTINEIADLDDARACEALALKLIEEGI